MTHHRFRMRLALHLTLIAFAALSATMACPAQPLHYPRAPRSNTVDNYHGIRVPDPYRPLEDPDSAATRRWVAAERRLTRGFLHAIPCRNAIRKHMTALWNYERYGVPWKEGGRYFWAHNDGLQNQAVIFTADSLNAKPRALLDPNKLSHDGTVALNTYSVSRDGQYLAYGLSTAGSDWVTFHVRRIDDGKDLPDVVRWSKFS